MISRLSFRLFIFCLFTCAAMALGILWHADDHTLPPAYFQTTASLFVIGLASFLVWFTGALREIVNLLKQRTRV